VIILDTNVISELMRPAPSPRVVDWVRSCDARQLYTTSITLAEVRYGIERLPDGRRKDLLRSTADDVFAEFESHVLPFDTKAASHYAKVVADRDRAGLPLDGFDAQIAAICRSHAAALATRNQKDFHRTGIEVTDPWRDESHRE
jgi:predicted nucleic acid-binding protein